MSAAPLFSLEGRVALVTGASRGLGFAMAQGLAQAGATVALNGRHGDTLAQAADALRAQGLQAQSLPFDVMDEAGAARAVQSITARYGRIDILLANAGIMHQRAPLAEWTPQAFDLVLTANLKSSFFLAQQVAKPMRSQGHGRIIFTTSILSRLGRATIHGYVASKSGLAGIARSLAAELGEHGITCNAIAPGYFETELTQPLLQDTDFVARINSRVPLRRWGKPRELAGVAVFLASDAASYVTGQEIVVDGGFATTI